MFERLTPTVRVLLIANVAIFAAQLYLPQLPFELLELWPLHSSPLTGGVPFGPWQLVTYAFLHGSPAHLFFNMFALYMFGPDVEDLLGSKRFRIYYLACVVGASVSQQLVTATIYPSTAPTLGASGGIFGLLLCYGMAYPHRRLMLIFPPIPMPAWLFVTLYGLAELYMGVFQSNQGVAHFAHLGGMAAGYLLIRYWRAQRLRGRRP
ncbi:MAG: rhomboid family intramembrane serine protease [Gammaproteobacteria bacterium]|nr:rhomboid family intramembrane serine protease [Gammaproteobacteria bacterium]MDE2251055.1 rhomboid family intramembrane serine protease [Gammaproteobacteria bacterium]